LKTLIVDDEPNILGEVSECLEGEGYEWVSAQNAADAIRLVESDDNIDIVVRIFGWRAWIGLSCRARFLEITDPGVTCL
jgi:DNA-binding NtrC family response regulator